MSSRDSEFSIRSLDSQELEHVIKTFAKRVGLHNVLSSKAPKEVIELEEVFEALSLESRPDASAKAQELLTRYERLSHQQFKRLEGYSVYWQRRSEGLFLWISCQPKIPGNRESMFNTADILKIIMEIYNVYITEDYRIAVRKRRIRRFAAMAIFYAVGLALIAASSWWSTGSFGLDDPMSTSFKVAILTIAFGASAFMSRRLGIVHGMLTMVVVWLFVGYFVTLTSMKVGLVDISQWQVDAYALALSALLGILVAELKNPLKTLGETLSEGGWGKVYNELLATPALIVGPTFGALKIVEYIVEIVVVDMQSSAVVIPAGLMIIVALIELIRREKNRLESR